MKGKTSFLLFVPECCQVIVQNEIVRGVGGTSKFEEFHKI